MRSFFDQAQQADHLLCRMDARVKIISTLVLLVMVLTYGGILFPLLLCVAGCALCASIGVRFRAMALRFAEPLFIIFVILLLKVFFSGSKPLFTLVFPSFTITAHIDGLMEGLRIGCRIIGAVTVVAVLSFSTPFNQFMAGLSWMKVPQGFVEVSMFAYRYIFMLFDDAMVIYSAQKNRLGYSTIKRGLNSFGILTGSLIIKAFDQSQKTTIAMTQRGYDGAMPDLEHKPFKPSEIGAAVSLIIVMGILWKI
jgi:cobalt/nickel transport system permease protein